MEAQIDNLVDAIASAPQSKALLDKLTALEAQKERRAKWRLFVRE
jgi:hypothetical protein